MKLGRHSLKNSVTIEIIIPIALTFLVSISAYLILFYKINHDSLERQLQNRAEQISISIQQALSLTGDRIFHKRVISVFSSNKNVVAISIYSISSNDLIISSNPLLINDSIDTISPYFGISREKISEYLKRKHYYLDKKNQLVHYTAPFYLKNNKAIFEPPTPSIIYIQIDAHDLLHQSESTLINLALLLVPTLFISLLLAFLIIRRKAILPAHQLLNVMSKQFHGDKDYYADTHHKNEFGELASHLNTLLSSLRSNETELRRLSLVASNTDNAVIITSQEGKIEWANPGFENLTGYSLEEARGKKPGDLLQGKETDPVLIAYMHHAIEMREAFTCDINNYKKDGSHYIVHIEAHPLYNEDEQFSGYMAIERDITREKQYQDEIFRNNQIMKAFINHMHSGVLLETSENQILHCNTKFCEIFGLTDHYSMVQSFPADKVIDSISSTFSQPSEFLDQRKRFIEQGLPAINKEFMLSSRKNISIDFIPISFIQISDSFKNGYLWHIHDVTQQKENENQLIIAREQAEAANQYKSEFLAKMSHEIRTPLNAIMGFSNLLGKHPLAEQQRIFLDKIENASQSLLLIINDILDFSKVEANKIELEQIKFELDSVLERVLNISNIQLQNSSVQFFIDRDPNIPLQIYSDPLRLEQVLLNLTNNAIKFTSEGEITLNIRLQSQNDNQFNICFQVSDTGIGLSEDQASTLFQEFNQADNSITRRFGGTGLGLAISQKLVHLMGGQITVNSQEGKGSLFSFTIPISIPLGEIVYYKDNFRELTSLSLTIIDDNPKRRAHIANLLQFTKDTQQLSYQDFNKLNERNLESLKNRSLIFSFNQDMDAISNCLDKVERNNFRALLLLPLTTQNEISILTKKYDNIHSLSYPCSGQTLLSEICRLHNISHSAIATLGTHTPNFSDYRFLLVEDNITNQEVAIGILEETAARIEVADNGTEAIAYLRENPHAVDLVLMDIQMPVMDGYEASKRIRTLQKENVIADFPIIAITANAFTGEKEKVLSAGMDDYISKPFVEKELFQLITKALSNNTTHAKSKENVSKERAPDMNSVPPNSSPGNSGESIPGLTTIPGLNIAQGIQNLGGREALYTKVLKNFPDESSKYLEGINEAIVNTDQETLVRCAHSLKSILHHVGAYSLSDRFKQLEALARENEVSVVAPQTEDIMDELKTLTQSIQDYLSNQDNPQTHQNQG